MILVTKESQNEANAQVSLLAATALYDGAYAYWRVARLAAGLAEELSSAYNQLSSTNKPKGLILDLRFAGGKDYAAAAAVADLFLPTERPLLDWGTGTARATGKSAAGRNRASF